MPGVPGPVVLAPPPVGVSGRTGGVEERKDPRPKEFRDDVGVEVPGAPDPWPWEGFVWKKERDDIQERISLRTVVRYCSLS